ncbi:MAG TPA: hypothetical protein VE733_07955 [Streptosporangiaceae bacterium]|nr:hypothetical protein [Streptosporangiaceae bacterium]
MDRAGPGHGAVHALFQQRYAGDDALLRLAGLRFAQEGLAAETYADTPDELDRLLPYVPPHSRLPTVHLNRGLNMLREQDRGVVEEFAARFAGRLSGMVVHDHADMGEQTQRSVAALRELDRRIAHWPGAPQVFVEYAAGLEPGWFAELAEQLKDADRISCCIDVGHVGIRQASARFARDHPGLSLRSLSPADERLPGLAADVQDAVASVVQDVQDMTRAIGRLGKHLHFHLHDGHPLVGGLSDHFTFLKRLPVPFSHEGRQSLDMMYGPAGLAAITATAAEACGLDRVSFTLEIHQVEGRLPLGDAEGLFRHWQDVTNAERMNYWLSVFAQNAMLVDAGIPGVNPAAVMPGSPGSP